MKLPDGSILMHAGAPYDPVKAHEYYIKRRQLHPRKKVGDFTVTRASGKTVELSPKQLAEQKAYAAKRITDIKEKLSKLTVELHKRMADARQQERNSNKKPTAADKAKAAKSSKNYRDSHKTKLATQRKNSSSSTTSSGPKTKSVDDLKQEVSTVRDNLKKAVAKQRELASAKRNG